jgi:HEAT repeat protein
VKDALARIGRPTIAPLTRFLATRHATALEAGLQVAVVLADPAMLSAAVTASRDTEPGTRARAATLAAALGGSMVIPRLSELLHDPEPEVRTASVGGLARLEYWPVAPQIATMLRDPAWNVRREAALALRALGPTGTLLLRRALTDRDAFARDAARQVLDLPVLRTQEEVA